MRTRRLLAVLILPALATAGCTGQWPGQDDDPGTTAGSPAVGSGGEVAWRPCPELLDELVGDIAPTGFIEQMTEQIAYECGTVAVPQDWSAPDAPETLEISLVRARSNDQRDRIGSLFVNPGGPGASGIESAVFLSFGPLVGGLPEEVTSQFDLVGFDPRGVGRSSPVECLTDAELDASFGAEPDPRSQTAFDAAVAETEAQAQACGAKYGDQLRHFSTRQTAHDLDALRAAAGDEQLSYLGFSYGTLLGAVYAQLYPERVRALVLDGAVDPQQDGIAATEEQAAGFERALDNFADWCAQSTDECPLRPDARTAVAAAIEAAGRTPVPGADGRAATDGWVFWAVVSTLYARDAWPALGAALEQLDGGDPSGVFQLADAYTQRATDGSYPNIFDANNAVNCADDDSDVSVAQVRDLQQDWRDQYPVFGAPLAMSLLGCAVWPADSDPYPTGSAEGAPPILVVGTLGDPATPYESTQRLADLLGTGTVLTFEGEGHTAYPGTDCVNDAVDAYLIDLTVPDAGTTCPAASSS
ncbi:MAG: alpha/beta fold hydrolase [Micromonosporaceae bacterium]|nr:alpha/beta fold hydrolase [Micromonosporaceae bacterium]